jgi:uncharacterized protein (DUF2342 family)
MDGVGPSVIPSCGGDPGASSPSAVAVASARSTGCSAELLGLEAKMAQYRDGAEVRSNDVVDKVGMTEFNAVFAGPESLPSKEEIHDPDAWISRVLST